MITHSGPISDLAHIDLLGTYMIKTIQFIRNYNEIKYVFCCFCVVIYVYTNEHLLALTPACTQTKRSTQVVRVLEEYASLLWKYASSIKWRSLLSREYASSTKRTKYPADLNDEVYSNTFRQSEYTLPVCRAWFLLINPLWPNNGQELIDPLGPISNLAFIDPQVTTTGL